MSRTLQTTVMSERAERTQATAAEQGGAHRADMKSNSDAKPAQPHLKQNHSADAQQHGTTARGAEEDSAELPAASGVNGLDLPSVPQPEKELQGRAANGASEAMDEEEPPLSGKEREVLDGSGAEEEGGFQFTKGAYFIGKCVWGKVTSSSAVALSTATVRVHVSG